MSCVTISYAVGIWIFQLISMPTSDVDIKVIGFVIKLLSQKQSFLFFSDINIRRRLRDEPKYVDVNSI